MHLQRWGVALAAVSAPALLAVVAPTPAHALHEVAEPPLADPVAPLVAAVALAAWALLGWLVAVVVVSATAASGGVAGRVARAVAARIAPASLRGLVAMVLGTAAVLPATAPAAADPSSSPVPPAAAPYLGWPLSSAAPPPSPPTAPPRTRAAMVLVTAGDTLWGLAARDLGRSVAPARVAVAWPSWWAANRRVIGADPDLIRPGQRLVVPPSSAAVSKESDVRRQC